MLLLLPLRGSKQNSGYLYRLRSLDTRRSGDGNEDVDDIDDDDDDVDELVFRLGKKQHSISLISLTGW